LHTNWGIKGSHEQWNTDVAAWGIDYPAREEGTGELIPMSEKFAALTVEQGDIHSECDAFLRLGEEVGRDEEQEEEDEGSASESEGDANSMDSEDD
jgi:hypothetical protein